MSTASEVAGRPVGGGLQPLSAEALRWTCPPLRPARKRRRLTELLGQERPIAALRTGLELRAPGYHVFVSGLTGTGRTALVRDLLEELQPAGKPGPDRVYVNNFRESHCPRLLTLPRGRGPAFQKDMEDLVLRTQDALQSALGSRPHKMSRRLVIQNSEARHRRLMDALARLAERQGCSVVQYETQGGLVAADIYAIHDGEALSPQALSALVNEGSLTTAERDELLARRDTLIDRLEQVYDRIRRCSRQTDHELRAMDRQLAARIIESNFRDFRDQWPQPVVGRYLEEVRLCVERDLELWVAAEEESDGTEAVETHDDHGAAPRLSQTHFQDLAVHVVYTSVDQDPAPVVVVENNPTFTNLFGAIEPPRDGSYGGLSAIHPGALLRADGGYLVLRVSDVLTEPGVWHHLKRALKVGRLEIREYDPGSGTTTGSAQPEAIPIDLKVVLIGEPGVYEQLAAEDPQFLQTFKVHAEFDTAVPVTDDNLQRYADFLAYLSDEEGLRTFSPEATTAVIEAGVRYAGRCDLLTTRFNEIADLAREASLCCERGGAGPVRREHVRESWRSRQHRLDLAREHVERDLRDGYLLIDTQGKAVGQVNSLTVVDTGTFAFGKPCRITASTGTGTRGRSGLVNIERESELSGSIHDKGVMILAGYLLDRFAQDGALCVQASLCFEQNYGGVDGDSASSAELYALISSLAKVPLDQGIGVTGSVNQKGAIQAVAAVNEKIEGFYRLCRSNGLTGEQGVVIPRVNVADLMLDEEIVEAATRGRFRVWAVDRIEDGPARVDRHGRRGSAQPRRGDAAPLPRSGQLRRGPRSVVLDLLPALVVLLAEVR